MGVPLKFIMGPGRIHASYGNCTMRTDHAYRSCPGLFGLSAKLCEPFTNEGKSLVQPLSVKNELIVFFQ